MVEIKSINLPRERERDFFSRWHQDGESQGTKEGVTISGQISVNVCQVVENLKIVLFLEKIISSVFIMLKSFNEGTGFTRKNNAK